MRRIRRIVADMKFKRANAKLTILHLFIRTSLDRERGKIFSGYKFGVAFERDSAEPCTYRSWNIHVVKWLGTGKR